MLKKNIPTIVLGGSGYVSSEVVGLLLGHPSFRLEEVVSVSQPGVLIEDVFPHLAGAAEGRAFSDVDAARRRLESGRQVAVFSAMPHGETAKVLSDLLGDHPAAKVVDMSADFRYRNADEYARVYGREHEVPAMLGCFTCALPDLSERVPEHFISHPGCFSTGVSLGLAPLLASGMVEPSVQVSSVTGSTGAGRQPGVGTHHPHRQSSMWAYQPLTHRHKPEIEFLMVPYGGAEITFVPHSGPFARGIHSTIFGKLKAGASPDQLRAKVTEFYAGSRFVKVQAGMPTLKEVVGTNRCHLGLAIEDGNVVVTSVIDNLVKGAAGGAVQWMNRLFGLDEKEGLIHAVPGWI